MSSLRYEVSALAPERHTVDIELRFSPDADSVDITMPAWCPGSYLIRDYARFVRDLEVHAEGGAACDVTKVDKQTWRIETGGARSLIVTYTIYGHDLTVRTNHIDADHAFLHSPATFMYPVNQRGAPVEVELSFPDAWAMVTAASPVGEISAPAVTSKRGTGSRIRAASIDELYDHPIHLGETRTYNVPAQVACKLAIWGERAPGGMFEESRLAQDLGAIVDDHIKRFGEAPFHEYTFLLMLTHEGYGGLEHRASSVNLYNPHFAATRKSYEGLLELLSHELFHAWNGKRIAPKPLLEFDYTREAYTPCLWVMEGVTSHYDRFALRSSGRITAKSYLEKVLDDYARLQATPGRTRQSLEQSSFDAWIKLYKPDESNLNTTVSYYLKGGLVMFGLDLHIRRRTSNARSLDDVLRMLWKRYGAKGVPHPDELQPVFEEATELELGEIFKSQIRGTDDPNLRADLGFFGLELRTSADPVTATDGATGTWLGVVTGGNKVSHVFDNSPAQLAGISPGDELIAVDGFRATSDSELRSLLTTRKIGEQVRFSLFRRHRLLEAVAVLSHAPPTRYEFATVAEPGMSGDEFTRWLGEPYPGPSQVLATVLTTARWV
ncbi:MAG TPA: PDZ domain-containing protein [Kofleriaceae bacterium]